MICLRFHRYESVCYKKLPICGAKLPILPLITTHPPIFQHRSVRTSTWFNPSFILAMIRSPGFGSIRSDSIIALLRLAFALASSFSLNQATPYKSPAHSSTGTRSNLEQIRFILVLPLLDSLRFHVLFHSPTGVLFTFPSRYYFAIGHPRVFSLTRWSSLIHTGFHVPHATRDKSCFLITYL